MKLDVYPRFPADTRLMERKLTDLFRDIAQQVNKNTDDITTISGSGVTDGDKGDITVSGTGTVWTVDTTTGSGAFVKATSPTLVTPILGTPSSGTLTNCTGLPVAGGGTGVSSLTAFAVICGGTTSTGAAQSVASVGTAGHVLTSNGAGALPTIQAASGGSSTQGKQAIYIAAGSMQPSIVAGPSRGFVVTAANQPDVYSLDFDQTTQEFAQFSIVMPKKWNLGTVTFIPHWTHTSGGTTYGVVWGLQAVAFSDGDNLAAAFGTAQTSTDTGGTNNNFYSGPESSAITVSGSPAAQDLVVFRVYRDPASGSDTLDLDARLHGVTVFITTSADTDA